MLTAAAWLGRLNALLLRGGCVAPHAHLPTMSMLSTVSGSCRHGIVPRSAPPSQPLRPSPFRRAQQRRLASSSSPSGRGEGGDDGELSPSELHALYLEQIAEIQDERLEVFGEDEAPGEGGVDGGGGGPTGSPPWETPPRRPPSRDETIRGCDDDPVSSPKSRSASPSSLSSEEEEVSPEAPGEGWDAKSAAEERDSLFRFTDSERSAWASSEGGKKSLPVEFMAAVETRRRANDTSGAGDVGGVRSDSAAYAARPGEQPSLSSPSSLPLSGLKSESEPSTPFTHLTSRGDGVSMVDVGGKAQTRRIAVARSVVVFPPEVVEALYRNVEGRVDLVGPKGPIFETARLAGIMGAKRTSDLIPLCHPLPLDRVHVDIRLEGRDKAIIDCECRVTHRTGVEMEALTGASIAALTIYDMVKAVSPRVRIESTRLLRKTGGKRDFSDEDDASGNVEGSED